MADMIFEMIRHTMTFLFGVSVSSLFLGIEINKKNILILSGFSAAALTLQGILYITLNVGIITMIYPLIIHLPLLILFMVCFKTRLVATILSITTAYMCCQIANWFSVIPEAAGWSLWATDIVYTIILVVTFLLVLRFVSGAYANLLTKPAGSLLAFSIIPVFYYVFDYISTVYTELLYAGHVVAIEFTPFLMSVCYLIFCTAYFKQYEAKIEMENANKLMHLKQKASDKEITLIKQNEKNIALLRHDMRHFFNNILNYIENDETDHAKEYIHNIIDSVDSTAIKKYCTNDTVNMILSSYENHIEEHDIEFKYILNIPKELQISDVDLTSILSNGFENAVRAVSLQKGKNRVIELEMSERNGKLLISLENTYSIEPEFVNGVPVSENDGHGFGTQSILYTAEKNRGNCQFSVKDNRFILQVVI